MALVMPLEPGNPHYTVNVEISGALYELELRWNDRDSAHYLSVRDATRVPVFEGAKIVLGLYLGRRKNHSLTRQGAFIAVSTKGREEAGFDELGARVELRYYTDAEIIAGAQSLARDGLLARP